MSRTSITYIDIIIKHNIYYDSKGYSLTVVLTNTNGTVLSL